MGLIPHPIPYQGSKRRLAAAILGFAPQRFENLVEPFGGSAALTLATAAAGRAKSYLLGEKLASLARLWEMILTRPLEVAERYEDLWTRQRSDPAVFYFAIRREFNERQDPVMLLFLLVRCVKNAVRFNPKGEFNQGPDNRRLGMRPAKMKEQVTRAATLLRGKTRILAADYSETIEEATRRDVVYFDPPYQGVSEGRDQRYAEQLDRDRFYGSLEALNRRGIRYLLSFDGTCGDRVYGEKVPDELGLKRVLLDVGVSSQATLVGRNERTVESLYLSPALGREFGPIPANLTLTPVSDQLSFSLE